jgi:hypothetical protein
VPLADEHLKYVWAAYRRGAFKAIPAFVDDLDPTKFRELFFALVGQVLRDGGEVWVAVSPTGKIPIGVIIGNLKGIYMEPHAIWFPEATIRNKLEVLLRFLIDMKGAYKLIIWVTEPDWRFFDHLCKYGVLRTVGKYRKFLPDDADCYLFQGVT